jgi:CBS domain containing-hemolysin-like protein
LIHWVLTGLGVALGFAGVTVAVSVATWNKRELARLVSQRLRGFNVATKMISSQDRTIDGANVFAAVGAITAGFGVSAAFKGMPLPLATSVAFVLAVPLAVCTMYAVPRIIGRRWSNTFAGTPARWVEVLAGPVIKAFNRPAVDRDSQLLETFRVGGQEEIYQPEELAIVSGVVSFGRIPVRKIMTPRTDVVSVEFGTAVGELARTFTDSGFSRLPVFREAPDNVIGMIYAFDLLKVEAGGELPLRPIAAAPESKTCSDLLLEMQQEQRQMAIVIDEFGGVAGVVTMDDLLKELVKQLFGDFQETKTSTVASDRMEFEGSVAVEKISAHFEENLGDPSEIVGALLTRAAGRIPSTGERFNLGKLEIEIIEATAAKIERVSVRKGPVPVQNLNIESGE